MHTALTLGAVRLHAYQVIPGREGEGRRLAGALTRTMPRFVACEVTPAHAVALQQAIAGARHEAPFLVRLAQSEVARGHDGDAAEDPFVAAARYAREQGATLVPLLPPTREPGFLQRRRLRRLVDALPPADDAATTLVSLEKAIRGFEGLGEARAEGDRAAGERLARLLFEDGFARVAAVLTPARAERILGTVKARAPPSPRSLEPPRELAEAEVPKREPYPAYR